VAFTPEERRDLARAMADRLAGAKGPTHVFLPAGGIEEWDRPGEAAHDPEGLAAFTEAAEAALSGRVDLTVLDCHINDAAFCDAVLAQLDAWVAAGIVPPGKPAA
ncbi:MAG: Tm-1-like ATP-binding domain-containing protein, partial [Tabrizicola sp.]